jgi:small-conductance mechanosensitive channel
MLLLNLSSTIQDFFNSKIVHLGDIHIKVPTIFLLLGFIILIIIILQIIKKLLNRTKKIDVAKRYAIYNLIKYFTIVLSVVIGFQIIGFNLSVLIAGSAALLVGIGLGLQNLFSDFISGVILLLDSSVKVNDIIEADGLVCKVQEINLRTTTVLTRDDKYIILPNSTLTRNQLINWTHSEIASRFEVTIGVDYSSDIKLVMKILIEAVEKQDGVLKEPAPFVRFVDYAESSLNFSVYFWVEDVFRVENIKSDIRIKINELVKANNITIPFPQRVIHGTK